MSEKLPVKPYTPNPELLAVFRRVVQKTADYLEKTAEEKENASMPKMLVESD